ncbi:CHASE2 domain-containing protein [Hyphomicrobium sp. 99]|uniref:CHASE2 domain-containing protein n=1 Tax=Hyphomicrobium sp. 99 TaxID=1163419 RepID=UPI0006979BB5|nr:CHASE2 domain-containing protein [Hyphomicrobium sp. 99]
MIIGSVLVTAVLLRQANPDFVARLRLLGFDMLQQTLPRVPNPDYPVRIIDIDEPSIETFGNWPWRRDLLAKLVDKLLAAGVRVVAFDMVFPDATPGPLDQLPETLRNSDELKPFIAKLAEVGLPDDIFAESIRARPVVLGTIGTSQATGSTPKAKASFATIGENVADFAQGFPAATGNLPVLEKAAAGVGALNWFPDHDQILRRIPTVVKISDGLFPSLVTESLRVFNGAKTIGVRSAGDGGFTGNRGITTVGVGNTVVRTDGDGQLWLYFSHHDPRRAISAADVLNDKAPANNLIGRIAIIGTSAPGLLDLRATPLDPVISGVEINAQALEQMIDGRMLLRPDYAKGLEFVLAVASALLLAAIVYLAGPRIAAAVGFAAVCLYALGALWAFSQGVLLDAVFPIMTNSAAYIFGTGYLYFHAESERDRGRQALQRIAREMEAAAQIQRTFLPKETPGGPLADKFDIFAVMKPAKSVGGDFFDYFLVNDTKLGFLVGDVSGKGVPAALFMSVSRTVLRTIAVEDEDPGRVLSKVNAILSRDNSEGMFVTIFYAVLDLETGALNLSSAGHDDALLLVGGKDCKPLHYMGPAIGIFDFADYPTETHQLVAGDSILLLTDGITEAFNIDGRVFGSDRLVKWVSRQAQTSSADLVQTLTEEVARFSEGMEQSDDITCVAMRFKG